MKDSINIAKKELERMNIAISSIYSCGDVVSIYDEVISDTICWVNCQDRDFLYVNCINDISCGIPHYNDDTRRKVEFVAYHIELAATCEAAIAHHVKQYSINRKAYLETLIASKDLLAEANVNVKNARKSMTGYEYEKYTDVLCREINTKVRQIFKLNLN